MAQTDERPIKPLPIFALIMIVAIIAYIGWRVLYPPRGGELPASLVPTAEMPSPTPAAAISTEPEPSPESTPESTSEISAALEPAPESAPEPTPESTSESTSEISAALEPAPESAPEPTPESTSETSAAPVPAAEPAVSPSFDVVRISPEGNAVLAGRAEPGAEVEITQDGSVIATVTADERGEWVALPEAPIESGSKQLALTQRTSDGETVESESVIVVVVPEKTDDGEPADQGALVVLMPSEESGGATILQEPAGGVGLKGSDSLSLDTIEYDETGAFSLGGRADAGGSIRAYIDNKSIGGTVTDKSEVWRISPSEPVTPGLHTLRIDQVDAAGVVIARLETPFARADFLLPTDTAALVVVQPGNSLWRIARRRYGLGPQYVEIFEANRDQISNPDLIYPGQIFELPSLN